MDRSQWKSGEDGKNVGDKGHQALTTFWGRQNCSPPWAPSYATGPRNALKVNARRKAGSRTLHTTPGLATSRFFSPPDVTVATRVGSTGHQEGNSICAERSGHLSPFRHPPLPPLPAHRTDCDRPSQPVSQAEPVTSQRRRVKPDLSEAPLRINVTPPPPID